MPRRGGLRIIAGDWRGRRLAFPEAGGLRPTGDRVRETVFNWLRDDVAGARVLDAFAGSGALGLEALSRGAVSATFVERSGPVAAALTDNLVTLGATDRARVVRADALRWLSGAATPFDLVFLDPPFRSAIIEPVCARLEAGGWLAPGALVYLEFDRHRAAPVLPDGWSVERDKQAGGVAYWLARRATGA